MNINFKVIALTRLGIKPESTAQETDVLYRTTRPSELLQHKEYASVSLVHVQAEMSKITDHEFW